MSRRRGNGTGDVRGPTSALTSFLKERGIRSTNIRSGFSRGPGRADGEETHPVAGPSSIPSGSSPASRALAGIEEDEDNEDDNIDDLGATNTSVGQTTAPGTPAVEFDEDSVMVVASSSRASTSKNGTSKLSRVEVSSATKRKSVTVSTDSSATKKQKQKKKKGDDEDYDEPDGDIFGDIKMVPKARYADRKPGSFAMCAECNKKFTITRYTNTHPDIAGGMLCGPCDKEMGPAAVAGGIGKAGAGKAAAGTTPAKKKARAVKNKGVLTSEKPTIMSLTKCCIEVIGKAISDVEEFGDIGTVNKDRVCQIVCKNRDLTAETVKLFLDVDNTSLTLYDCTNLEPDALRMLANLCPNLKTLKLFLCGYMDKEIILHFANRLTHLKHLQLYGAFLVRKEAWIEFFDIYKAQDRSLDGFMIRQSPRIEDTVLLSLVNTSPNLTHLQLTECGAMKDSSLSLLHSLKHLQHLDLAHGGLTGETFTDDGIIPLLENVGEKLTTLILDDNLLLTDRTLIEGIKVNCPNLIELSLKNLGELLPTGIMELFGDDWVNKKGFARISLNRCIQLDDEALTAIIKHSGTSLLKLDLNSVDGVREAGLKLLGKSCPLLTELDISFVRETDDFLLKHLLDNLPSLKKISIYGDNRISDLCPSKAGVRIHGHEQGVMNFD